MERSSSPAGLLPREISQALRRFQRRFLLRKALGTTALFLATGLVLFGAAVIIDRLFVLSRMERWALTCAAAGTTAAVALAGISRLVFPGGSLRWARRMESAEPRLKEALLSSVEIARLPESEKKRFSPALVKALFRATSEKLEAFKVEGLVDLRRACLFALASAGLWGALAGLIALDALSLRQLASRFLHPGSDIPRPSSVLVEVSPGEKVVARGDDVEISARVLRGHPLEGVISWRFAEGEWMEARTSLEPAAPLEQRSRAFSQRFTALRRSLEYRVHAGDFWSPTHRIAVRDPPRATEFQVTYEYPAYTGRPPRVVHRTSGDLDGVRGTKATLEITAGEPLVRSRIELIPGPASESPMASPGAPDTRSTAIELSVAGHLARVEGIPLESSGAYRLYLEAAGGVSNGARAQYAIRALPDRPPSAEILEPAAAEVELEESSFLRVRCSAEDDVGIRSLELIIRHGEEKLREIPILENAPGAPLTWTEAREIPVAGLQLQPGESATFLLRAEDTLGNEGLSTERGLRIAFLPDPPEGPRWPLPLERIERDLDAARTEWKKLGASLRGAARPDAAARDPAFAERLESVSEKALALGSFLQGAARAAREAGREIKVPSLDRRALERLGAFVLDVAEEDCAGFLEESLSDEVSTERLMELHATTLAALEAAGAAAASMLLAERLEGALERCLALRSGLDRARRSLGARTADGRTAGHRTSEHSPQEKPTPDGNVPGNPPSSASSSLAAAALSSTARILFREAASLAADLASWAGRGPEEGSGGDGPGDAECESLSREILEGTAAELSAIAKSGERDAAADAALERALATASKVAQRLSERHRSERSRSEELGAGIDRRARTEEILAELAEASPAPSERSVPSKSPAPSVLPAPPGGKGSLPRDFVARMGALIRSLQHDLESCDSMPYKDIETSGDLAACIEIVQSMAREASRPSGHGVGSKDPDRPSSLDASSAPWAALARELLSAWRATAGSRALGRAIQEIHHAAGGEEEILWRLRATPAANLGALQWVLRAQREISIYLGPTRRALVEMQEALAISRSRSGSDSGSSIEPSQLDRGLESLGSALDAMDEVLAALGDACGMRLPGPGRPSPAAAQHSSAGPASESSGPKDAPPARDIDLPAADLAAVDLPAIASRAARDATVAMDRSVKLLEEHRSSGFPEAESARAWLRLQRGSSSERARALAARERGHASVVRGLSLSAAGPEATARVEELLVTHEEIRREVEALAVRVRREGDLPSGGDSTIERLKVHDGAASKLAELAAEDLLDASRTLGEVRASPLDGRAGLLLRAAVLEEKSAEKLGELAEALALVEMGEALASAEEELGDLLKETSPPEEVSGVSDPARVLAEARLLLSRTLKAAQVISAKLRDDPRKALLLSELTGAAELFRKAAVTAEAGKGPEAAECLARGKESLRSAVALARRIREDSRPAIAKAGEDLESAPPSAADGKKAEASRELEAAYRELEKILELDAAQDDLAALFEDVLKGGSAEGGDFAKLKEKARDIEKEIARNILTSEELMEIVSRLLLVDREGRDISRLERTLAAEAEKSSEAHRNAPKAQGNAWQTHRDASEAHEAAGAGADTGAVAGPGAGAEAGAGIVSRQAALIGRASSLLKDVHLAGFKLSAVLPLVLKAYWKALDAGEPLMQAMQDALGALEREVAPAIHAALPESRAPGGAEGEKASSIAEGPEESSSKPETVRKEEAGAPAPAAAAEKSSTASRKLLSAADKVDVLLSVLAELRQQALQAIADSERGTGEASSTQMGLERARRGILETLSLLESGNAAAASRAQQASRRSIADGASALRARIGKMVLPGAPGGATMASGGTAWQVLTRGAPLPGGMAAYLKDPQEMPFPAGFRELLKVYFKAILEARP